MSIHKAHQAFFTEGYEYVCGDCAEPEDDRVFGTTDTPQHCIVCEALLPLPLTAYGYDYVANSILEHLVSGKESGRTEVLQAWAEEYPDAVTVGIVDMIREDLSRLEIADLINGALE